MARDITNWLSVIFSSDDVADDLALARFLLGDLTGYRTGNSNEDDDIASVLAFIGAVRVHQAGKPS